MKNLSVIRNLLPISGLILFVLSINGTVFGQLFSQDFTSSTVVSDYVSATPNNGQFNSIGSSGAGTVVSINGGTLQFARTGNAGSFSRTTDFSPTPTAIMYKIDITVSGNTAAQTTAAVFQVGSNFGTANSAEANADTYARFAINFTAIDGTFSIRDVTNGTNSGNFSGTQTITWVLNNTGNTISYLAPDGTTETVANDTADLWIGTTRAFNDVAVQTPTQTITDLKFAFTAGVGTIRLDNIQVSQIAPTAANAIIGGRVMNSKGFGIMSVRVILTGGGLTEPIYTQTSPFGYYRFVDLPVGENYVVTVESKRYTFSQPNRLVSLGDNVTDADFVADAAKPFIDNTKPKVKSIFK